MASFSRNAARALRVHFPTEWSPRRRDSAWADLIATATSALDVLQALRRVHFVMKGGEIVERQRPRARDPSHPADPGFAAG